MSSDSRSSKCTVNPNLPQANYFAVIPANVRYCSQLCANAKLLYGEITALTNQEGFCWATNSYFSSLYGVDERTIRRWLENLRKNGFIEIESSSEAGKSCRKISLTINSNKDSGGQKCPGGRTKMSAPLILHNNTKNLSSEKEREDLDLDRATRLGDRAQELEIMTCKQCVDLVKSFGITDVKRELQEFQELPKKDKSAIRSPCAYIRSRLKQKGIDI